MRKSWEARVNGRFSEWTRQGRSDDAASGPRVLHDWSSGEMMTVVERRADGVAGARAPKCLIFHTDRGFTRLWDYPADWAELSDEQLRRLEQRQARGQGEWRSA